MTSTAAGLGDDRAHESYLVVAGALFSGAIHQKGPFFCVGRVPIEQHGNEIRESAVVPTVIVVALPEQRHETSLVERRETEARSSRAKSVSTSK